MLEAVINANTDRSINSQYWVIILAFNKSLRLSKMIWTEPSKLQSALFKHEFGSWLKLNKRYAQFVLIKNMSMSETVYPIIKSSDHSLLLWHLGKSYKVSQNCQMQHLIDDFLKSNKMIYGICSVTAHNCKMLLQSSA